MLINPYALATGGGVDPPDPPAAGFLFFVELDTSTTEVTPGSAADPVFTELET